MAKDMLKKLTDFMDSDEGKAHLVEYFEKLNNRNKIEDSQLLRFHLNYSDRMDFIMDKIRAKYESNEYQNKWYNKGYEPPTLLYFFLFSYAEKYGVEGSEEDYIEYGNMFTASIVKIKNWLFNMMNGQGTVIKIHNLNQTK